VYLTNIEKRTFYNIKLRKLMHKLTIFRNLFMHFLSSINEEIGKFINKSTEKFFGKFFYGGTLLHIHTYIYIERHAFLTFQTVLFQF